MAEKISVVHKSTKLGFHKVMLLKDENGVLVQDKWGQLPDEWGIVYGRFLFGKKLHFWGSLVGQKINPSDLRPFKDEEFSKLAQEYLSPPSSSNQRNPLMQ